MALLPVKGVPPAGKSALIVGEDRPRSNCDHEAPLLVTRGAIAAIRGGVQVGEELFIA